MKLPISIGVVVLLLLHSISGERRLLILGGHSALSTPPYLATIFFDENYLCSGSLYNSTHVITAAHCCLYSGRVLEPARMKIAFGLYSLNNFIQSERFEVSECHLFAPQQVVRDIFTQQRPLGFKGSYDFALLKLSTSVESVTPIETFKDDDRVSENVPCVVMGFGMIGSDLLDFSRPIKSVDVQLIDFGACQKHFKDLPNHVICAGDRNHDACKGDSGGPLLCEDLDTGLMKQLGVVSFGNSCDHTHTTPGLFTDIRFYLNTTVTTIITTAQELNRSLLLH